MVEDRKDERNLGLKESYEEEGRHTHYILHIYHYIYSSSSHYARHDGGLDRIPLFMEMNEYKRSESKHPRCDSR